MSILRIQIYVNLKWECFVDFICINRRHRIGEVGIHKRQCGIQTRYNILNLNPIIELGVNFLVDHFPGVIRSHSREYSLQPAYCQCSFYIMLPAGVKWTTRDQFLFVFKMSKQPGNAIPPDKILTVWQQGIKAVYIILYFF